MCMLPSHPQAIACRAQSCEEDSGPPESSWHSATVKEGRRLANAPGADS